MRQHNITKGIKGARTLWNSLSQYRYLSEKELDEIKQRLKVLDHAKLYGIESACSAFDISRRTYFRWSKVLALSKKEPVSLRRRSTRPKKVRERAIDEKVETSILSLRNSYPRLGKDKIVVLLQTKLGVYLSASTVGRILKSLKERGILKPYRKLSLHAKTGKLHYLNQRKNTHKTRRKGTTSEKEGDIVQVDTVVFFNNGIRYYLLTAIDIFTRKTYVQLSKTGSSLSAREFLMYIKQYQPILHIQTDNGSEFHKYFDEACVKLSITHFWNYPRSPKQNAFIERFNRTIQEEFLNYHKHLLYESHMTKLKAKLSEWMRWYNYERPHHSLYMMSPVQYNEFINKRECQM